MAEQPRRIAAHGHRPARSARSSRRARTHTGLGLPLVPAKAGTQSKITSLANLALDSRLRGDERVYGSPSPPRAGVGLPLVPAKAGTQSKITSLANLALDSRLRGNERL